MKSEMCQNHLHTLKSDFFLKLFIIFFYHDLMADFKSFSFIMYMYGCEMSKSAGSVVFSQCPTANFKWQLRIVFIPHYLIKFCLCGNVFIVQNHLIFNVA